MTLTRTWLQVVRAAPWLGLALLTGPVARPRTRVRSARPPTRSATRSCSFALPAPVASPRFVKVAEVAPGWWVHRLRITDVRQLDQEVQDWLRESYRLLGQRERLGPRKA